MKVSDFIEPKETIFGWKDVIAKGRVIALSSKTGKVCFDSYNNKTDYIKKYYNQEVLSVWASVIPNKRDPFSGVVQSCIKMYISEFEVEE